MRGYTIMAEGRTTNPLPSMLWGMRILSNPEFPDATRGGIAGLNQQIPWKDITGPCKLRKDGFLFRFRLSTFHPEQVVSIMLSVKPSEIQNAVISLQLYKNNTLIKENTGTNTALIPVMMLLGPTGRREVWTPPSSINT